MEKLDWDLYSVYDLDDKLSQLISELASTEEHLSKLREERDKIVKPYNDAIEEFCASKKRPIEASIEEVKKALAIKQVKSLIQAKIQAVLDGTSPGFVYVLKVPEGIYGACVNLIKEGHI